MDGGLGDPATRDTGAGEVFVSATRRPLASVLAVASLAVAIQLPVFDRTMSMMDEGHILQFADMLTRGAELYRDATLLPLPGGFYLLAGAFEIFGPSIRLARWIVVAEFALLCVLVFLLLRRMLGARWAWAGAGLMAVYKTWAFPHWHMYSYSTTATLLLTGALGCLIQFLDSERRTWLGAAGLLAGLGIACKQDYGAAGFVALGVTLLIATRSGATTDRPFALFATYVAPAAAVGAVIAIHYGAQGLFTEMLQQTALNHFKGIATFEYSSLPPLFPLLERVEMFRSPYGFGTYAPAILFTVDWETVRTSAFYQHTVGWDLLIKLFFYAPYAIVAAAAVRIWWIRGGLRDPLRRLAVLREIGLASFAVSLVLVLNKPVDYVHVAVLYWPLLLLLLVWTHATLSGRPRLARALAALALIPALAAVGYTARLAWLLHERHDTLLRGERGGVYVQANDERVIGLAVDYLREQTRPDQQVAVLPYFPLLSFLAERDAPHRAIYTFWPIEYIPGRQQQIADAIDASGVDLMIYHFTQFVQFPRMNEYAPELFAHLVDHFEMDRVFSDPTWGYMLTSLRRSKGEPEGIALVDAAGSSLRLRFEAPGRPARRVTGPGRDALMRVELWPFRPVIAVKPLAGGRSSVVSLDLTVPPGSRLRTAVGVHPTWWFRYPPTDVTFRIRIVDDGARKTVFTRKLTPHVQPEHRRWFDVEVPLEAWSGRPVSIELVTECSSPRGEVIGMSGWEIPRLVVDGAAPASLD